ncbi:MAG TPA: SDR family NAD(P)-dependent oxidoreductase [Solirubrobacteraceae bacterium]|jgi:short-subunit dehydrogenase|nr:SDR family NAD(P)-dependent oxidoreductase [Solirubrobacteraceae bacterium]
MKIDGSKVLLTGATGGLGNALARGLHARGARLVLTGRSIDALTPLAAELGAEAIAADLSVRADVERLAGSVADLDVLISNAALPASGHLLELSQRQIDTMLEVNLSAPIALVRAFAPAMSARGSGQIVLVSSLSGKSASPASSIYTASKFGLRGFALSAREDLRSAGVGVSVIMPGFIRDAGMYADAGVKLPPGVGTSSPAQVTAATITAIERNRGEVTVAPLGLRLGANLAAVAPGFAAAAQRRMGSVKIAERFSERQTSKRPAE